MLVRGDELVAAVDESGAEAATNAGTGGSAVASGAPGDAKRRALDVSDAESTEKIRQPASLQVPHALHEHFFCCFCCRGLALRLLAPQPCCVRLTSQQLPGQIDAFGVEVPVASRPSAYAALNEQLLSQLTYQLADSDKKVPFIYFRALQSACGACMFTCPEPFSRTLFLPELFVLNLLFAHRISYCSQLDEIGRRFTGVGGSLQLLSREVAVMSKKLEQLLQQ